MVHYQIAKSKIMFLNKKNNKLHKNTAQVILESLGLGHYNNAESFAWSKQVFFNWHLFQKVVLCELFEFWNLYRTCEHEKVTNVINVCM